MAKIFISLLLLSPILLMQNPSNWELKEDKDYIKVYVRDYDTGIKEFLGETVVDGHIDSVFSFIMNFDYAYQWMYKVESSKTISSKNKEKLHVYFTVDINWPLTDRDLIMEVTNETKNRKKIITLYSKPKFIPEKEDYVRIIDSKSVWTLENIDEKRTKVSLKSHSDIRGIPNWITDLFITKSPFYGLKNLRKEFD